ncbi:MAG: Ldh family oxidoreductase [Pseudomonadota bacterium]
MDTRLSIPDAEALVAKALTASGVSDANAASVARALVAAEVDGQGGHGFARVSSYCAQARSGKVAGHAVPNVTQRGPAMLHVDAGKGFAYPALDLAISKLAPLAQETGIAAATISDSHHAGQMGAHVERIAREGLIGLMVANTPAAMAPWGGNKALFGTNPIAFAAPRRPDPLVIDLSLSRVARGKIMAASKRGEPIPEGWALDHDGQPTTDANAALGGMMIPTGDAKGAALALMVEILAASLTGAQYSYEASSFFEGDGPAPQVGQTLIAIDPARGGKTDFGLRLEALIDEIEGQDGARLPGTRRLAARAKAQSEGVAVPARLIEEIEAATQS